MPDEQYSDDTKKEMRDTVLRWIGENNQPENQINTNLKKPILEQPKPEEQLTNESSTERVAPITEVASPQPQVETKTPVKELANESKHPEQSWWRQKLSALLKRPIDNAKQKTTGGVSSYLYFAGLAAFLIVLWAGSFFIIRQGYLNENLRKFLAINIPIPYAHLGSHVLWLSTWYDEREAISHYYAQSQTIDGLPAEASREIANTAMVRRAMIDQLAAQYDLRITNAEIEAEVIKLQSNLGPNDNLNRMVESFWGWSLADFKSKLVRPYLLKQKLLEKLKQDPVIGREFGQSSDLQTLDEYLDKIAQPLLVNWIDLNKLP